MRGSVLQRAFLAAAGLLLLPAAARALSVTASVNRSEVHVDEQLVLSVVVTGAGASQPQLPSLPNFRVYKGGSSERIQFANGKLSRQAEYQFLLSPVRIGKVTIPPISVTGDGGQTARTDPISVTILRSGSAPSRRPAAPSRRRPAPGAETPATKRAPDMFVTAETDKRQAYVDEQIIWTIRFFTAVPLGGDVRWDPPVLKGFLKEDLPQKKPYETMHEGRRYAVNEVPIALFPAKAGKLTISPSSIHVQVVRGMAADPFAADFFNQFFSRGIRRVEPRTLKTNPITIRAKPLPDQGRPKGFRGAVGSYRVGAEIDRTTAKVGDALNLTVIIQGEGNLKSLGELKLPDLPQFRVYETVTSINQHKDAGGVRGNKSYKTVLVPKASGKLKIPPIGFHFFDPKRGAYVSKHTDAIELDIAPGEEPEKPAVGFQANGGGRAAITTLADDIRHVRSKPDDPAEARLAAAVAGAGWLHAFPVALLLSCFAFSSYREKSLQDPAGRRSRSAMGSAKRLIRESRSAGGPEKAAQMLADAVAGYLADKLDRPVSGLTLRETVALLAKKHPDLPAGHIEQLKRIWTELEMFRFAPAGTYHADTASLAEGALELLHALEEGMKR